eukprot:TRINITY_DN12696_c0_g1_i1.p1 TRINITY_DN12696_c0_g1~~TRINITY_DN12696_c0_g1_i1.p1  ORF type:complete len:512 (+),score=101.73 TRINITY_DN12696_c0_g1_i1:50-1585(+)
MRLHVLRCSGGCIGFTGVVFFAVGLTLQFVIDGVVSKQAQDMLPLKGNDSALFQPWVDHGGYGSPIYNEMFVWNLTNPEEYLNGEVPNVEKIGPFVYRMFDWRENVTWSEDPKKENISFTYHNFNVFVPERTDPSLDLKAKVYMPNYALQGVLTAIRTAPISSLEKEAAFFAIREEAKVTRESLLLHRTIDQVMWGFDDPLLTTIVAIANRFHIEVPLAAFIGLQMIDTTAFYAEPSIQYSGTTDYRLTAQYRTWCGKEDLSEFWPLAPEITGSDGWQFSPDPDDIIPLFIDSLPAVVNISKRMKTELQGIHSYIYEITPETWDNSSFFGTTHNLFSPNGVLNATASQTANIFISKPHFLDADPFYMNMVTGVEPGDNDRDNTFIWIEPITGSGIAAKQRIQINLQMSPWLCDAVEGRNNNCSLAEAFVPLMIANQYIDIPPNEADALKSQIYGIPNTVKLVAWILFGLSFALVGWTAFIVKAIRTPHYDKLPENDDIASAVDDYERGERN